MCVWFDSHDWKEPWAIKLSLTKMCNIDVVRCYVWLLCMYNYNITNRLAAPPAPKLQSTHGHWHLAGTLQRHPAAAPAHAFQSIALTSKLLRRKSQSRPALSSGTNTQAQKSTATDTSASQWPPYNNNTLHWDQNLSSKLYIINGIQITIYIYIYYRY